MKFKDLPRSNISLPFKVGYKLLPKVKAEDIVENDVMKQYPYRTLIGCLQFLASRSRPDITFAVNIMSQFCSGYTYQHWTVLADIVNYVFNTRNYMLNLSNVKDCRLVAYSDASWGSILSSRHSMSHHILLFGNIPFSWKSSKQNV